MPDVWKIGIAAASGPLQDDSGWGQRWKHWLKDCQFRGEHLGNNLGHDISTMITKGECFHADIIHHEAPAVKALCKFSCGCWIIGRFVIGRSFMGRRCETTVIGRKEKCNFKLARRGIVGYTEVMNRRTPQPTAPSPMRVAIRLIANSSLHRMRVCARKRKVHNGTLR